MSGVEGEVFVCVFGVEGQDVSGVEGEVCVCQVLNTRMCQVLKGKCVCVSVVEEQNVSGVEGQDVSGADWEVCVCQVLKKYLTGGFCGHDKEGSPVRVELYGHLDMKGLMYSAKKVDLEKTKLLQCELTVRDWQEQSGKVRHSETGRNRAER